MSPGSFAGDHDHVMPYRYIWSVQCLLIVLMLPFLQAMNDAPFSNRSISTIVFIDENVNWEGSRHNATASDHISILNSILLTLDLIYVIPSWQSLELVFVARHHLQQLLLPGVIYGRFSDRASWASKHWTCQQNNLWTQYNLWKKHVVASSMHYVFTTRFPENSRPVSTPSNSSGSGLSSMSMMLGNALWFIPNQPFEYSIYHMHI